MNSKILTIDKLAKRLKLKKNNPILIQCHGVFDILHIGHIKYLEEAKKIGNILIVTVTSDKFVKKGIGNPYFNEDIRAQSLSALQCVDYVVINYFETPIKFIKKIKPNVYVKGPDYKKTKNDKNLNLEKKTIESVGGKIFFTSGQTSSSSMLINNYTDRYSNNQKSYINNLKNKYSVSQIENSLNSLSNLKVLLIGETIIDEYVYTEAIGKAGKEPIMVSKNKGSEKFAGGIVAVANQISSYCKNLKILSYLGDKNNSVQFIKKSINKNIKFEYILKKDSPTILKKRFIDLYTKTKMYGVYNINDNPISESEEKKFINLLDKNLSNYDLVLVIDYGHGLITEKVVKTIEKNSKFLAVNIQLNAMNTSFYNHSKYKKMDYFCIHDGELRHGFRDKYLSTEKLIKKLDKEINAKKIMITKGKKGTIFYEKNKYVYCPAFASGIVDKIGAGDTLIAITSLCFRNKIPSYLSSFFGNILAAKSIQKTGTGNATSKNDLMKIIKYTLK